MIDVGIIVVGGGAAGLSAAGALVRQGLSPLVIERAHHIGAVWEARYDRLHLHTIFSSLAHYNSRFAHLACEVRPVVWYAGGMTPLTLTITNEQVNSLPLLLGILNDMGIRDLIDTHVRPHGNWQGASVGTLLSIWLSHILQERDHRLVALRDWAAERLQTINSLLDISLRDSDCTDDRLATLLTLLGDPTTQAALDAALLERWLRIYRLPSDTVRLDSTSVSVYHDDVQATSLLQQAGVKLIAWTCASSS